MRRILIKAVSGLLLSLVFSGCLHRERHVFMGDHGTLFISRSDLDERSAKTFDIVNVGPKGSVWSVQVDADPERVFWLGERRNGNYPVVFSSFGGEELGSFVIPGLRRLALDPENNRIVYETAALGKFSLKAIEYDEGKLIGEPEGLVTSARSFSSLSVNPGGSGKLFWVDRDTGQEKATLQELDLESGSVRNLASSEQAPFLWRHVFLAFDPAKGHVYWSQNLRGGADDLIGRANYTDGSDAIRWISNEPDRGVLASYPAQIAIDYRKRDLYWADMNMNWVATAKLSGATLAERDPRLVSRFPLHPDGTASHPTTLAFSHGKLGLIPGSRNDLEPLGKLLRRSRRTGPSQEYVIRPSLAELPYPWE